MVQSLRQQARRIDELHRVPLADSVATALVFDPLPAGARVPAGDERERGAVRVASAPAVHVTGGLDELAFLPVTALSELVRRRKVTSTQLTRMYLDGMRCSTRCSGPWSPSPRSAPCAGRRSGPGDRPGAAARPPARHPLGRKGPAGRARLPPPT